MALRTFATESAAVQFVDALRSIGYKFERGSGPHMNCAPLTYRTRRDRETGRYHVAFWNAKRLIATPPAPDSCTNGENNCNGKRAYATGRCRRCCG